MTTLEQTRPPQATVDVFPEPAPRPTDSPAVVAVVMDFVGATLPQFDDLLAGAHLKSGASGLPGSLFQWSRATPDGVRVTEVWRSRRHYEMFRRDVITPQLAAAGLPAPEVTTYEVHSYLTQGPVIDVEIQDARF